MVYVSQTLFSSFYILTLSLNDLSNSIVSTLVTLFGLVLKGPVKCFSIIQSECPKWDDVEVAKFDVIFYYERFAVFFYMMLLFLFAA